jgi:nitroreductase
MQTKRMSEYPIEPLLLHRWSPRAMSGEPIARDEFMRLLEAARWAPSSYNNQPWRFVYGFKGTPAWDTLFSLLTPANQEWAKNSAVFVLVVSATFFTYNRETLNNSLKSVKSASFLLIG